MALVVRLVMFLAALVVMADRLLPDLREGVRVDGHEFSETRSTSWRHGNFSTTDYRLRFAGGRVGSCEVGYTAYNALKDGDEVVVSTTRVFKACERISRAGETIVPPGARWLEFVFAALLFAGAFGWIDIDRRSDSDDVFALRRGGWWLKV